MTGLQILTGDCRDILPTLETGSVQCCITSPPYWGLRDYGTDGQLGLEATPEEAILIELNPAYIELAEDRTFVTPGFL